THPPLAAALAAAKRPVPVAHVEAGLRSSNRRMPDEINRILTDHLSALLFAPSAAARQQLEREGIAGDHVRVCGDVMADAALHYRKRARKPEWFDALGVETDEFMLCTLHRAEHTDCAHRLRSIFLGLSAAGRTVLLRRHPRPRQSPA